LTVFQNSRLGDRLAKKPGMSEACPLPNEHEPLARFARSFADKQFADKQKGFEDEML
jgi:hypothetical protein